MMIFDDDDEDGKATKQKAQASPCHESNQKKKMTVYMNEGLWKSSWFLNAQW